MNAWPLIVTPPVAVVVVDDRHVVPIISAMVDHSVSRDVGSGRGIAESDSNEGDDDQNHHQSEAAEPSNPVESLGRVSLLVCFRPVLRIDIYQNRPPATVFVLHFRDAGVTGNGPEVSSATIPSIKNSGGDSAGVIRGVEVSHDEARLTLEIGVQVRALGIMVHCLEPLGRLRVA